VLSTVKFSDEATKEFAFSVQSIFVNWISEKFTNVRVYVVGYVETLETSETVTQFYGQQPGKIYHKTQHIILSTLYLTCAN